MKNKSLILLIILFITACARREKWEVYEDSVYPISMGYLLGPNEMSVEPFETGPKEGFMPGTKFPYPPTDSPAGYRIDVKAHLPEFDPPEAEVPIGLYEIVIYKYEKDFRDAFKFAYREPVQKEKTLNKIPVILISDPHYNYEEYILLVPGIYATVYLDGLGKSERITRNALKHFRWTQPIDASSPEFQSWKKHILEILKAPDQSPKN